MNNITEAICKVLKRYKILYFITNKLTAKGSACSHVIEFPQVLLRVPSLSDSGTMNIMNSRFMIAMPVAKETTLNMPVLGYCSRINVPRAGLITRLAANMAETCGNQKPSLISLTPSRQLLLMQQAEVHDYIILL